MAHASVGEQTRPGSRRRGALRHRDFAKVWLGQVGSVVGSGMHRAAILWWAKQATGSNGAAALVAVSSMIPLVVLSPVTGAMADRFDRRRLMIAADAGRAATSAALAVAMLSHTLTIASACAITAIAAAGESIFEPAFTASIATLVPEHDRAQANALNFGNSAAGGLLGPAIGGLLIAAAGTGWVLAIDAITFAWSAALIFLARIPRLQPDDAVGTSEGTDDISQRAAGPLATLMADVRQGARAIRTRPSLVRLAAMASILNLCAAPISILLVALVTNELRAGAVAFGALDASISAGVLVGAMLAPPLARRARASIMTKALVAVGVALASIGAWVSVAWAAGALAVTGVSVAVANTSIQVRLQREVEPSLQGRVFGMLGSAGAALRPGGALLTAPLVALAGVRLAFACCGTGIAAATLIARPDAVEPNVGGVVG